LATLPDRAATRAVHARAGCAIPTNTLHNRAPSFGLAGTCRLAAETANQEPAVITREPTIERLAIAQGLLLDPFGLSESHLAATLAAMGEHRIDDADLYFQTTRHEGWSLEEGIVKSGSFSIDQGVGVRAVAGEKTAFAYSDDISAASLMDAARTVRAIAAAGQSRRVKLQGKTKISSSRLLYGTADPIATLDSTQKVALLERIEKMARARDPRVVQVMAGLAAEHDVVLIARADGTRAADVRPLVRLSITVIAEQNGRRETGSGGGGGRFGLGYFTDGILAGYVDQAVNAALVNLESRPVPAGEMTVVLGPGWPGVLLHEAVGHGLEGDFNRKGSSTFAGRIGKRVAAKGVTVLDDGTIADRRGSLNVDDEGNASQRNVLIEDGILRGYIQDSMNARLMGVKPTGNGRRESYAHTPMPRMTNTYMLAGDKPKEEIVASIKRGLYATNFGGGQVDITSGKFVFSASEAYWVENGKILYPVKGATLIGNGPEALTRISMIGNDLELDSGVGVCGKEGQSVPVGVGQPTLRIDGLVVGGTA
jgi:TldD protein